MADTGLRVVGLAVKKEKWHKHISQTLLDKAREAGFILKQLDQGVPLEEQGRLDALLQKLREPEWEEQLERYAEAHPEVKVFDRPAATLPIRNRGTMLTMLEGDGWLFQEPGSEPAAQPQYRVSVPTNTTLQEGTSLAVAQQQVAEAGLQYPMLAKPVWADGREGSHALAVIATEAGLQQLVEGRAGGDFGLPVLLQQYVPHGGCLFKVYVLGSTVVTVKRGSLELELIFTDGRSPKAPQLASTAEGLPSRPVGNTSSAPAAVVRCQPNGHAQSASHQAAPPALQNAAASRDPGATQVPSPLPSEDSEVQPDLELIERVSAYPRSRSWGKWDLAPKGSCVQGPPAWLMQHLAQRLRRHLGLNLFNFDVIVPLATQEQRQQQPQRCSSGIGWLNGCRFSRSGSCDECDTCAGGSRPQLVHVIDINYFPGYEKLPGYEELMLQFLTSIWAEEARV